MKRLFSSRKRIAAVATAAVLGLSGGAVIAYFTAGGSGSGAGATGSASTATVIQAAPAAADYSPSGSNSLFPGGSQTEAARRLGIGRALLRAVIDEAARRELPSIVLEVADDNAAARGLYASAGFVAVGRRTRYYRRGGETIDALLLRCPVNGEPRPI